jgi:simple sugar transport system permease protein
LGTIPASVLFGGLLVGADRMQRAVQVPSSLIDALLGLVVLFVVSSDIWVRYRARRRQIQATRTVAAAKQPRLEARPEVEA